MFPAESFMLLITCGMYHLCPHTWMGRPSYTLPSSNINFYIGVSTGNLDGAAASTTGRRSSRKVDRYIIIFDMNGLLMDKGTLPAGGRGARTYKFRKSLGSFFLEVRSLGVEVVFWTCAMEHNAEVMFAQLRAAVFQDGGPDISGYALLDQSKCEEAEYNKEGCRPRFHTKPFFFKSLTVLFRSKDLPADASFENTLLIDDTPYKNLLNPPHNAVHPPSFDGRGDSRTAPYLTKHLAPYLRRLVTSGLPVQTFVEQNRLHDALKAAKRAEFPYLFWGVLKLQCWHGGPDAFRWVWNGCTELQGCSVERKGGTLSVIIASSD